jgi:secreted trypsin-like serine protease
MRKLLLIVSLLVVFSATPALAVTDGELDGNGHPMVGIMVASGWYKDDDGKDVYGPMWRCSGTLLSPTVYLTAGHCVEQPADMARVWFEADMRDNDATGYPDSKGVTGKVYVHPEYYDAPWWMHDLGIVVLDTPVYLDKYGKLPGLDEIDKMVYKKYPNKSKGTNKLGFTAVGYGLQKAFTNPKLWHKEEANRVRMFAEPKLIQINVPGFTGPNTLVLSNNTNTGGTCFGDSGGPNFIEDSLVVGAVTSFGTNGNCAGLGGVQRVDRQHALDFIEPFLD